GAGRRNDRLRAEAAALPDRIPVVDPESGLRSEAHAELPAEFVARDHDSGLDHHLADRRVDLADDLANLLKVGRYVLHEEDVRPRIDHRDPALRNERSLATGGRGLARPGAELLLAVRRDEVEQVLRLDVVQLERFGNERLQL